MHLTLSLPTAHQARDPIAPTAPRGGQGLRTRAFAGLRHARPEAACLDLGLDCGDPGAYILQVEALRTGHPLSVRHLSWPASPHESGATLRRWQTEGAVRRDPASVYLVEYTVGGHRVRGVVVELDISSPDGAGVIPHEDVDEDRVARMRGQTEAGRVDVEPVLLVQDMTARARRAIARHVRTRTPEATVHADGLEARLWRISGPDADELHAQFAHRPALLADGHHRFSAHAGVGHVLAMITDAQEAPLRLGAIHRVAGGLDVDQLLAGVDGVCARSLPAPPPGQVGSALRLCADDEFLLTDGRRWLGVRPPAGAAADVVTLHALFDGVLEQHRVPWSYRHEADEAVEGAVALDGSALLLHPPSAAAVLEQVGGGRRLPEKATSFWPKPPLSLVIRDF